MTMQVELVYGPDCPNVPAAREALLKAFVQAGVAPRWTEWSTSDPQCPEKLRRLGSPSVLVEGRDVGTDASEEACCRLYGTASGRLSGVPPVESIAAALVSSKRDPSAAAPPPPRTRWSSVGAAAPAIGVALLPKVVCPMCWPAYAGLASAAGLGFLLDGRNLLIATLGALAVVLASLAWRATKRRGYGPLALGAAASVTLVLGKFLWDAEPVTYAAGAILIGACVWNAWPRRASSPQGACPACPSDSISNEEPAR